jgi:hypothetical protein
MPVLIPIKSSKTPTPDEVFQSILGKMDEKDLLRSTQNRKSARSDAPELITSPMTQTPMLPDFQTQQLTPTISDLDIQESLAEFGVVKETVSPHARNEAFRAELNAVGATTKNVAMQLTAVLQNSNSDSARLAAARIILAVNGISFNHEEKPITMPQINIVLNNGVEDRRIASMLNPR